MFPMVCDGAKRQAVPDTPKSCKTQAADSGGQRRTRKRLQNAGGGQWRTAADAQKGRKTQVADTMVDSSGKRRTRKIS